MALLPEVRSINRPGGISITQELVRISGLTLGIWNQNLHFDKMPGDSCANLIAEALDFMVLTALS